MAAAHGSWAETESSEGITWSRQANWWMVLGWETSLSVRREGSGLAHWAGNQNGFEEMSPSHAYTKLFFW